MKAMRIDTFGGPEVLHEAEVDIPKPGPGQYGSGSGPQA